jgi:hypothetical protein
MALLLSDLLAAAALTLMAMAVLFIQEISMV